MASNRPGNSIAAPIAPVPTRNCRLVTFPDDSGLPSFIPFNLTFRFSLWFLKFPKGVARFEQFCKYFFVEFFGKILTDPFANEYFSPIVFDDPPLFLELVDFPSYRFPWNSTGLTEGKGVGGFEVLHPLRMGRRFLMDFDAVALAGKKSHYVMMSNFTEHNGQNQVPITLPVEKVEIAEEKVPHDDRNRRPVSIVPIRLEGYRELFVVWFLGFIPAQAFGQFGRPSISMTDCKYE
jgi:hypothetical protein